MATTLKTFVRRTVVPGLAAGALAGVLVACGGGGGSTSSAPAGSGRAGAGQVNVRMVEFKMKLSQSMVTAGAHTFVAKNDGHTLHAMEIVGPGVQQRTPTLKPGQSAQLTVTLKNGTYQVFCPVDGHKDLGMKTRLTVGGTASPSGGAGPSHGNGY